MRAAELSDLSPCVTAAQWFEPHLRRRWKQAGWPYIRPLDSMPGSLRSGGESISAIFSPSGISGSNPKAPHRHHPRRCNAVQPLTGLQGVQYHLRCNDSWPGIKLLRLREVERTTSFQFHGNRRTAGSAVGNTANPLKPRTKLHLLCLSPPRAPANARVTLAEKYPRF